jgi:hypothetical protein
MREGAEGNAAVRKELPDMKIRVLSFEGCPHVEATVSVVEEALQELGLPMELDRVQIHDESDASHYHFLGSPSVQIDGNDLETGRREDAPFFGYRLYRHGMSTRGVPPKGMIVEAIQAARRPMA